MLLLVNHKQDHHRHHHQQHHHLLDSSSSYPPNPQTPWYWPPTCSTSGYFEPKVGQSQALPSVPAAVIKCQSDLPPPQIRPPWPTNRTSLAPPFRKRPLPEIQCQQIFTESGNDSEIIFTCGLGSSPFVTLALNCVFEDWKLRLIKEQVCQSAMINHKSIYVSASIHLWR